MTGPLVTQPTNVPTPKVAAAGISGGASLVLVWLAGQFGVEMPEAVAGAIVLLAAVGAAWLKRERKPRGTEPGNNGRPDHGA